MVNSTTKELGNLSYEEKRALLPQFISLGTFSSDDVFDKLILVSLVSLVYLKLKKTKPKITPLEVLLKISGDSEVGSYYYNMLESLALLVEEFCYQCTTSNAFNMTDSKEIINKIKELLSAWTPF